jgi:hypothetical protein
MKTNHKHPTRAIMAIIVVSLILMCQNANAQPGYSPWLHMPPYNSIIVPYPPTQSYRQVYNPYIHTVVVHPLISLGIHFDPLISWFSTDSYNTRNEGVVPGFNFGISYNRYFSPNYSFSSGINIINAGGRLISGETTQFELKNYSLVTVQPGEAITYKITYLTVPLGVKLRTSQIGFGRFFTDLGFDPKIVIGARADIPSLNINGGNALPDLNTFNLSFHIMAGMQYPLGGNNTFTVGIGFDNNLFDLTRDNGGQPSDLVSQKSLSFHMGITF